MNYKTHKDDPRGMTLLKTAPKIRIKIRLNYKKHKDNASEENKDFLWETKSLSMVLELGVVHDELFCSP